MTSLKLALVVFLAFGAIQCQSASVAEPEPRDLDLVGATDHAIKIVRNVIGAVEKGINDSKPNVEFLIQQLQPDVGKAVREVLDKALALAKKERERIEVMIKAVETLKGGVIKIRSCTDPQKKDIERVFGNFETGLLRAVRETLKNQSEPINDLKAGFTRILGKVRKIFDNRMKGITDCIKPGTPNAEKCLKGEVEKIKKEVVIVASEILMFWSEVNDVFSDMSMLLVGKVQPVLEQFMKESDPVLKKVSDCIAKMK